MTSRCLIFAKYALNGNDAWAVDRYGRVSGKFSKLRRGSFGIAGRLVVHSLTLEIARKGCLRLTLLADVSITPRSIHEIHPIEPP
jgi:hypothetical protein